MLGETTATRAQRHLAQNLLLERELARIARGFSEAGVELAVLKGVPLTRRLYGGLDQRFSVDNDLLVRKADAVRGVATLKSLGYDSVPGRTLGDDLATTFQHPMRRQGAGDTTLRAELHWHAFPTHLFEVPEADLWHHMVPFELDGQVVSVFDEAMTLLHLVSHHVQHRCLEAKVLRDVGGAWQRWQPHVEGQLVALARRYGLASATVYSLTAAHQAGLCAAGPGFSSLRAALLRLFMPAAADGREPSYRAMLGSIMLAAPRMIPVALRHELFPPLPILARIYSQEPSRWLYARYPLRLLRPLKALFRR
jgi:hypothetical protein